MKGPDLDRERSERKLSFSQFLATYNEELPSAFPRASAPSLKAFSKSHPELFRNGSTWSLDQHRKRVMDWLPRYLRSNPEGESFSGA